MIVLDDLMSTSAKDRRITDLFTEGSHHRNLSVVVLNQNLYFSKDPTQRRNCHYLKKIEESASKPFGYVLFDLKPTTPESKRLLSNVFQQQSPKFNEVIPSSKEIKADQNSVVPYSYEDDPSEQTHEDMPSCDDCGVVLDSMHDLQTYQTMVSRKPIFEKEKGRRRP
ncbi:unnamed protein product [Mytilus coruscus]|uniref:Uncharacterized protein n=1 Tax=Mytilus coruscus TaxID=42192 RepID=A0A6J8D686_MYTCO|nr:unnamed protein product [Mytilus coruscus]